MINRSDFYSAFALTIASPFPLIELPRSAESGGEPDVTVVVRRVSGFAAPQDDSWVVRASPAQAEGWAPGAGRFVVRAGREIVIEAMPDADDRAIRLAIVGPLLGVILTQRGRFVLHASTVAIDGEGVAFCGPSGRGKSTLAAALTAAGHPLIADDMTVIDTSTTPPQVQPGFPRVKLWPDSVQALRHAAEELPLIHPDREKRSLSVGADFSSASLPLRRCYLLEDGESESSCELPPMEAMLALIKYTYQSGWLHESGAAGMNLLQSGALVRSGVVRQLRRRRAFEHLPAALRFIEADSKPV